MPTALRDMQPWRRAVAEAGMTLVEVAQLTGKSHATVLAYSGGHRRPTDEWCDTVVHLARMRLDEGRVA